MCVSVWSNGERCPGRPGVREGCAGRGCEGRQEAAPGASGQPGGEVPTAGGVRTEVATRQHHPVLRLLWVQLAQFRLKELPPCTSLEVRCARQVRSGSV